MAEIRLEWPAGARVWRAQRKANKGWRQRMEIATNKELIYNLLLALCIGHRLDFMKHGGMEREF